MKVYSYFEKVKIKSPLIHHITNWVTIYDCAQVAKAIGASPVMAHAPEEVVDMAKLASALVLNIGTLTEDVIGDMKKAARAANEKNIPVILDVCGAGATPFRDQKCIELLESAYINIIKGNSSEIARIAGLNVHTKGVDAEAVDSDLHEIASDLAINRNCVVIITGKEDIISDSNKTYTVRNGVEMMSRVVGTGCMATSIIGAFAGTSPGEITEAAAAGLCCYGIAAELSLSRAEGPLVFKHHLIDSLYKLTEDDITSRQKVI